VEEARRFAYKNSLTKKIDAFTQHVLDLILVFRVSNINVTSSNLENGLNLIQPAEKKQLESLVQSTSQKLIETKKPLELMPGVWTSGEIEVLDKSELTENLFNISETGNFEKETFRINQFLRQLKIEPIRNSRLVKVHFDSSYPELSAKCPIR
jgi:hypothetical protein